MLYLSKLFRWEAKSFPMQLKRDVVFKNVLSVTSDKSAWMMGENASNTSSSWTIFNMVFRSNC